MDRLTIEYCGEYVPRELCSMDRLGGVDDCDLCCEYCKATEEGDEDCRGCAINQCFNKLGEYENTAITPEQIREIDRLYAEKCKELANITAELEKLQEYRDLDNQGKLLKLPCAVGDTIYTIYSDEDSSFVEEPKVVEVSTHRVWIDSAYFDYDDFGKTVFLEKEAAEKALKEMEDKQ